MLNNFPIPPSPSSLATTILLLSVCAKSLQSCLTLCDPMDCSLPGSLSMGFSRQEYWSGLPLPSPSVCTDLNCLVPHIRRIIQYSFFCDWLISPSLMPSRFTHVDRSVRISFLRLNNISLMFTPHCVYQGRSLIESLENIYRTMEMTC